MARGMTEASVKKAVLTKVGELTGKLTSSFATAFNVDQNKISSAFKMKISEDEITRIVSAMLDKTSRGVNYVIPEFRHDGGSIATTSTFLKKKSLFA